MEFAYSIPSGREDELSAPPWLASEKFDIAATCPADTSRVRVREMTQTLLAERFGFRAHRETKTVRAYALVAVPAKRSAPLQESAQGVEGSFTWGEGRLAAHAVTMASLADRLSGPNFRLGRPVVDQTGMPGAYEFTLRWTPDAAPVGPDAPPSLFTALEEQLGVKLETRDIAIAILVVDRVERSPTGN